ncbi:MAG: hypothetical protein ACI9LA_001500 [Bacteroidia bacterium]|jgi:hypothetical protein
MSGGFDSYANVKHVKVLRQVGLHVKVANIDLSESGDYFFQEHSTPPWRRCSCSFKKEQGV